MRSFLLCGGTDAYTWDVSCNQKKMKKHLTIISMICFLIISCEEKPAYEKDGWTVEQYQPELIEMSKATINGNSIISPIEKIKSIYGKPKEIKEDCSIIPIHNNQGEKTYDCWIYDSEWSMVFKIDKDQAFLGFFNFEEKNMKIETPQISLSKNTTIKEIKKVFPISYSHRNIGAHHLQTEEGFQWIYLIDDLPKERKPHPNKVELIFKDGYLKQIEYQWQPIYSEKQWDKYQEEMEKYLNSKK
jgi:hypothetical protein